MGRRIELKKVKINENETLDYGETIQRIIQTPPSGVPGQPQSAGFSIQELRKANKILDALEKVNGVGTSFNLEDDSWDYLNKKIQAHRWGMPHREIEIFVDSIENAETVDINHPEPG